MLVKLNSVFDQVMENFLYNSLINPENKEMYIKTMSFETLEKLISGDDDERVAVVWRAIHRAIEHITKLDQEQAEKEEQEKLDMLALESIPLKYVNPNACPRCGYEYANGYKVCPNCACDMEVDKKEKIWYNKV